MPAKRYIVTLTENERTQLQALVHKGRAHAFRRRRAQIWLVDAGPWGPGRRYGHRRFWAHSRSRTRVYRGLAAAGLDHPRRARRLDGAGEAELSRAGTGWTLQLLADRLVAGGGTLVGRRSP